MPILAALLLSLAGAVQDEDEPTPFSSTEANYKLTYPHGWTRTKNPQEIFQLSLLHGTNFIGISGAETEDTVESLVKLIELGQKQQAENWKEIGRRPARVAGERAVQIHGEMKRSGFQLTFMATVFTHQGFAYRIVGVYLNGMAGTFEKDYDSIVSSFAFLADRKEWLEMYEGKPVRTAFLAGLSGLELNRPRWTEISFSLPYDWTLLEQLYFEFLGHGAWITLRARMTSGAAAAELDRLRADLAGRLKKSSSTPAKFKAGDREIPGIVVRGEHGGEPYFMLGAVVVEEGVCVDLFLEGYDRLEETTRRDWNQLLKSFVLQPRSKPVKPLAYALRSREEHRAMNGALAAVFAKARRVAVDDRGQICAVSPDGSRVLLLQHDAGNLLLDTATGKSSKADFGQQVSVEARWSRDGLRLLWPGDEGLCVATIDPPMTRTLGVRVTQAAFGAAENEFLACTSEQDNLAFPVSRLERIGAKDERKMLIDFPLSRVSLPELSPDKSRLAVVLNRDYPRSAPQGGHLYVGTADGTDLRQLTREPESIERLCWSPDGRFIYAVRRIAPGKDGAVGNGGPTDLWRIQVESGEAKNLTRSDHITGVWASGDDLLIAVKGYALPESQRGLFRIPADALDQAASALPERPIVDADAQGLAVADAVHKALGGGPIRDVVPTPERMAAAAKAFAAAVRGQTGVPLDFSRESLDELHTLVWSLGARGGNPTLVLGFGAYYGETLRAVAGAEWMLQPVPFGDAAPGVTHEDTPLADPVLPFSDVVASMLGSEDGGLRTSSWTGSQDQGRRIILVHPPSSVGEALRTATGKEYYEARKKIDAGDVRPALDLLIKLLERHPKNGALAQEVIGLCEAARLPDAARDLTRKAVDAGTEVPELLLRYADDADADPARIQEALRRATAADYVRPEVLIRLGKSYAAAGDRPLAEACWRKAHANARPAQRGEIQSLLGTKKSSESED